MAVSHRSVGLHIGDTLVLAEAPSTGRVCLHGAESSGVGVVGSLLSERGGVHPKPLLAGRAPRQPARPALGRGLAVNTGGPDHARAGIALREDITSLAVCAIYHDLPPKGFVTSLHSFSPMRFVETFSNLELLLRTSQLRPNRQIVKNCKDHSVHSGTFTLGEICNL